jgi:hypothetical protein
MIILSDGVVNDILFIQFNKNNGWTDTQSSEDEMVLSYSN